MAIWGNQRCFLCGGDMRYHTVKGIPVEDDIGYATLPRQGGKKIHFHLLCYLKQLPPKKLQPIDVSLKKTINREIRLAQAKKQAKEKGNNK